MAELGLNLHLIPEPFVPTSFPVEFFLVINDPLRWSAQTRRLVSRLTQTSRVGEATIACEMCVNQGHPCQLLEELVS